MWLLLTPGLEYPNMPDLSFVDFVFSIVFENTYTDKQTTATLKAQCFAKTINILVLVKYIGMN